MLQIAEGWTRGTAQGSARHAGQAHRPHLAHHLVCAPRLTGKDAFTDVYSVMNNWGANHGAFIYGHIGADLITLARMLRIPGVHAQRGG